MTVRLGFFGAGFIADYHASMLDLSGADAAIINVFDPDTERASQFTSRFGGQVTTGELEVLDGVDAVYICTPTATHPRLVAQAVERGLPVFCEKPLGVDVTAARQVAASVAAAGVISQVGLVLRDSPAMLLLAQLLADPADGEVMTVAFRDDQYLPTRGQYRSVWRADVTQAGAGTLLEHSIHDLDLLEWLLEPRCGPVTSVSCRTRGVHGIDGIEDVASVHLGFESGADAQLVSVWHDVLDRPSQRRIEVFRQRGWYALEGDVFGPVRWTRTPREAVVAADKAAATGAPPPEGPVGETGECEGDDLVAYLVARGVPLRFPDAGFIDAVATGRAATPDVASAVRAHVLVDAAYRSAALGGVPVTPEG